MISNVYYIFSPTPVLIDLLEKWAGEIIAPPRIVIDQEDDRAGAAHSPEMVKDVFWRYFLLSLSTHRLERVRGALYKQCFDLGFGTCWNFDVAQSMGTVEMMIEDIGNT